MYASTIFLIVALVVVALFIIFANNHEKLVPYRGMPSSSFSYTAKQFEDPIWSDSFMLRGIAGGIPDECHAWTVGPDIVRFTPEDIDFAKSAGMKLKPARHKASSVVNSISDDEKFRCPSAIENNDAQAAFALNRIAPTVSRAHPLLLVNKELSEKKWDPVLVGNNNYSYKI